LLFPDINIFLIGGVNRVTYFKLGPFNRRKLLILYIVLLVEKGIVFLLQMESKSSTPCEDEPLLKPISYENILVAFFILPIGILISAITFLVERVNKN